MCAWAVDGATNRPTAHRGIARVPFQGPSPGARSAFHARVKAVVCARGRSTVLPTDPRHTGLSAAPFEGRFRWPKEATLTDFIAPSVAEGSARYRVFREAYFGRARKKCLGALHGRDTHCAVERVA